MKKPALRRSVKRVKWRRRESNPRAEVRHYRLLRACLADFRPAEPLRARRPRSPPTPPTSGIDLRLAGSKVLQSPPPATGDRDPDLASTPRPLRLSSRTMGPLYLGSQSKLRFSSYHVIRFLRGPLINHGTPPVLIITRSKPVRPRYPVLGSAEAHLSHCTRHPPAGEAGSHGSWIASTDGCGSPVTWTRPPASTNTFTSLRTPNSGR